MEKNLLSKLDPKGKEHQRKKVLRLFFTWNNKQDKPNNMLVRFWNWVKILSPDNLSSNERFKSMSYEFLDKLLSKKIFRDSISYWIEKVYMPCLTKSSEDEFTKYFLQFVINSIGVKVMIETSKQKFLQDFPDFENFEFKQLKNFEVPCVPGTYVEYKCPNDACVNEKAKKFGFVGSDFCVDLYSLLKNLTCPFCNCNVFVLNLGFFSCKYIAKGLTIEDTTENFSDMINYYTTFDELHFYDWKNLIFSLVTLKDEEKNFLDNLVYSSFNDPTIPKKKYCKRKEFEVENGKNDIKSAVLMLEKEIRELDSQIYDLVAHNYKNKGLIQEFLQEVGGSIDDYR